MTVFRRLAPLIATPLLLAFLLLICPAELLADEGKSAASANDLFKVMDVPTNLGMAYGMAGDVADKTLTSLSERIGDGRIAFRPGREHSGNSLMITALTEAARAHGLRLADNSAACDYLLDFSIIELRIAYTGTDRSAFFFKKEIERAGTCVLASRLIDGESSVEMTTLQQEVLVTDSFPGDMLKLVESKSYTFTSPEYTPQDWSKAVEPFVVTGLITGLVYLFFSNQSSD